MISKGIKLNALLIFLSSLVLLPMALIFQADQPAEMMIQLSVFFSFLGSLSVAFYLTLSLIFKTENKSVAYGLIFVLLVLQILLALDMAFGILRLS